MATDPRDPSDLREQIAQNQQAIDRLNRDLARRSDEVRIIQQISSEITSTLDLDEVLGIVLRAMDTVLGFAHSMILLKDLGDDAPAGRGDPRLRGPAPPARRCAWARASSASSASAGG